MATRPGIRRSRVRTSAHEKLHAALHPAFPQPLFTAQELPQPRAQKEPNRLWAWIAGRIRSWSARGMKVGL